jgi:hypothetical protein
MRLSDLTLLALLPMLAGCPGSDDAECGSLLQTRCDDDGFYECREGFDNYEWVLTSRTCPGPPPPVVDPRCKHVRAYCESERVIVHCDGPHFNYKVDCTEDPNLPDVEPEVDVALCTPHEEPPLLCPEVGRVHGYACVDERTIAHCSYGYVVEYSDCPDWSKCVASSTGDDVCSG